MAVDMILKHLHGNLIITAFGDDDIGIFLAGLHKLLMHGLHGIDILVDHGFQTSGPFHDIPLDPADQADIGIRIYKHPDVIILQSSLFSKIRIPSTITTLLGTIVIVSLLLL